MVGDTEFWFKIACHYDVVVAQPSLIYWRQHEGQEFFDGVRSGLYAEMNFLIIEELMENKECTLLPGERMRVLKYYKKNRCKTIDQIVGSRRQYQKGNAVEPKVRPQPAGLFLWFIENRKAINVGQ